MPFLTHNFANANSSHLFGLGAHEAVKTARLQVADLIGSDPHEIIFTSGATEAINLGIKGLVEKYGVQKRHLVTVVTEHMAVLDTCKYLETKGFEVTYLPVQKDGLIRIEDLQAALRPDTLLVCVMLVNNEIGVIQDIQKIAELSHANGSYFMTDATQAVGKMPVDVDKMGIDLMAFSAHKFYGPKGIGALYMRQRGQWKIKLPALIHGGGHERGFRSGTLNVPGIIGLGKAAELTKKEMKANEKHIRALRDYLEDEILKMEGTSVNGNRTQRLYNVTNIQFEGVDSEALILGLGSGKPMIAVSNGSACTSAVIEPSHVLLSMGIDYERAFSSIRFSLGKDNQAGEISTLASGLKGILLAIQA